MQRSPLRTSELPIGSQSIRVAAGRCVGILCLAALTTSALSHGVVQGREIRSDPGPALEGAPRSILVAPVLNETTYIEAAAQVEALMTRPLAERGYYVFPFILTDALSKDLGLSEAGHVHELPPARFRELFGADTVLFVVITDWGAKYWLTEHGRVVALRFTLRDTRRGEVLWASSQTVEQRATPSESIETKENSAANGLTDALAELLANLIVAPIAFALDEALEPDYSRLAEQAIAQAFNTLPPGPYCTGEGTASTATPCRGATSDPILRWFYGEP